MGNTTGGCGCCGSTNDTAGPQELTLTTKPTRDNDGTTECPVMAGTPVDKAAAEAAGLYRDYAGQRYWFCCPGCAPAFDADPAMYAAA